MYNYYTNSYNNQDDEDYVHLIELCMHNSHIILIV